MTRRLKTKHWILVLFTFVDALVLAIGFVPAVKSPFWQTIHDKTDLCDEFARARLAEVPNQSTEFWFIRLSGLGYVGSDAAEATRVLDRASKSSVRSTLHTLLDKIDAQSLFTLSSYPYYSRIDADQSLKNLRRSMIARAESEKVDSIEAIDYWRFRQFCVISELNQYFQQKFARTPMELRRHDPDLRNLSPVFGERLRPKLNLRGKNAGLAPVCYLEVDYRMYGGAKPRNKSLTIGSELLVELFEPELSIEQGRRENPKFAHLLRFTPATYLNWCELSEPLPQQSACAIRILIQRHWNSPSSFLRLYSELGWSSELDPEAVARSARRLELTFDDLTHARKSTRPANPTEFTHLSGEPLLIQLLLKSRSILDGVRSHKHFLFDPVYLTLMSDLQDVTIERILDSGVASWRYAQADEVLEETRCDYNCSRQCHLRRHNNHFSSQVSADEAFFLAMIYSRKASFRFRFDPFFNSLSFRRVLLYPSDSKFAQEFPEVFLGVAATCHQRPLLSTARGAADFPRFSALTAQTLSRCLKSMVPSERERFLNWLYANGSTEARDAFLRPLVSKRRQAKIDHLKKRQLNLMDKAVKKYLAVPFNQLTDSKKLEFLNYLCATCPDFKLKSEHLDFVKAKSFFVRETLISNPSAGRFCDDFAIRHRSLILHLCKYFSWHVRSELKIVVDSEGNSLRSIGMLTILEGLSLSKTFDNWRDLFEVLLPICKRMRPMLTAMTLFGLNSEDSRKLFNALFEELQASDMRVGKPKARDYTYFLFATKSWQECLRLSKSGQKQFNRTIGEIIGYSRVFTYLVGRAVSQNDRKMIAKLLLTHYQTLNAKDRSAFQASITYHGDEWLRFFPIDSPIAIALTNEVMAKCDDRGLTRVFSFVLHRIVTLKGIRERLKNDEELLNFLSLCHMLGPIALSEKEFLLKQLNHKRDRVVIAAILALSRVDWPANFMLERLTEIINDKSRSGYVRGAAICAMRRFEGNSKVGERLREFIDSKSLEPLLRDAAKRSLPVWEYYQKPVPSLLDWPKDH